MPRNPDVRQALQALLDDAREDLHVALPGRVQSYDSAKQVADIKPMLQRASRNQDDERSIDPHPVIPAVPVAFPRGAGFYLVFPLVEGDTGTLVFCERDLSSWRATGQDSDPLDEGMHTLAGAVFFPGLHTSAAALAAFDHLVIGKVGGAEIHLDGTTVQLGAAGGGAVALAGPLQTWAGDVNTALSGLGAPVPPLASSVAATKAKAT